MVGQTLGHFRITARLGSGGMGIVYRAHDEKLDRTVAIKVIGRETAITPVDRARIVEEARASSALSHPNICTVYEIGEIDGQAYIAMEYVEGRPLSELIPVNGLPPEVVVRYGAEIADALEHAHVRGVVHRDLKTPNVVISADGRAKVLDFGLARRIPSKVNEAVTRTSDRVAMGPFAGTLPYMPPELLLGQDADERSDIWSFGVTVFEMATGELPFKGRNEFELTAAILRSPPQPLPAQVPPMIRSVIQRCLSKDPAHRYQRAGEARAALEAIQSDSAIAPASAPAERVLRRGWLVGAAAAGLALTAVAGWWLYRERQRPPDGVPGGGRLIPAVTSDAPVYDPAISPDGKMLSYGAEDANGQTDLFVRRVAGGALIKLTDDPARESTPRFSPDGERIVFTRRESADGVPELRVVPALGGDTIASIPEAAGAAWSADGQRLAFLRRGASGQTQLIVSAVDGGSPRLVLESDSTYPFMREPAWAADGTEIAIVRGTGGIAGEIWLVPVAGGPPRRPFSDPPDVFADSPVFTTDGRALIHSSNRGGATNLWAYPARGGAHVRLTTGPGPDIGPTVAADGTIAFLNSRWRNALEVHSLGNEPPRTLTTHSPFLWAPVFSPDAKEIAFSRSEMDGSWHIWSIPAAGGTARRLTAAAAGEVYSRYSPDGRFIWFHTWQTPRRVGRVARQGGAIELLSFGADGDGFPDPSPDGSQVVVTRTDADAERLYVAPSGGGTARRLTSTPGAVGKWSPDGKRIAFAANRGYGGGILVVDVSSGREQRLTRTGGWPEWLPSGSEIAYLVLGRTGNQEIQVVAAQGGTPRALGLVRFNGWNYPFAISPDGKAIATSNSRHISDEIWLIEPAKRE
jgi:Tol biopolymer transport system component/predicted Ser/Thr protein kinase